jgi:hypothetical protein
MIALIYVGQQMEDETPMRDYYAALFAEGE